MKFKGWTIAQAYKKEFQGFKPHLEDNQYACLFYTRKEDAREALVKLMANWQHEQSIGWRTKDNFDKETGLDFLITEIEFEAKDEPMLKRGWKLNEIYKNK